MEAGSENGQARCSTCGTSNPVPQTPVARAYDKHRENAALQSRVFNILLVVGDCIFIGMQPILVYMSKVDGKFLFSPVSVNFLTELTKVAFAVAMLFFQARRQRPGESSLLSIPVILRAARANVLLAVPAGLYAVNNYLKFVMQLYFKPATVKMLSNLKVLTIALLLKLVMRRQFSLLQWEALCLLLIGISINQMPCGQNSAEAASISNMAYLCTFFSVTIPSAASVYNEFALKKQFDTSVHLQNLFMYCYGASFNLLFILMIQLTQGGAINLLHGHSRATMALIANNAMQGILSSFFFKYADTILKKYSSTVATIFTGLASAALFGHAININFVLGVSVVLISMHQFFSSVAQPKDAAMAGGYMPLGQTSRSAPGLHKDVSLLNMTAGAVEEVNHFSKPQGEREQLLPR